MTDRVTVVGSINVDIVVRVDAHPAPGETILGLGVENRPGGKGANQAAAAASAGAPVSLVGCVGRDDHGARYVAGLAQRGVDVAGIGVSEHALTGQAYITVSASGENSIIVVPGANTDLDAAAVHAAIPADTRVVLTQLEIPIASARAALARGRELGAVTVLNASPVNDETRELLALADVVVVNEHEDAQLGHPQNACVTMGARGARWGEASATPPRVSVVDTTGAGDMFVGVLAARLAAGASRQDALTAAVDASAHATEHAGAQDWRLDG